VIFWPKLKLYIGVASGVVPVDGIIAVIGDKDEEYEHLLKEDKKTEEKPSDKKEADAPIESNEKSDKKEADNPTDHEESDSTSENRIKASPLAKKMAEEAGLELTQLKGTGEQGRIVRKDIEAAMETSTGKGSDAFGIKPSGGFDELTVTQMRKTIARRLGESKFSAPHFYLTMEIEMDKAIEGRSAINDYTEQKISFNDLVVKAVAVALRQHPAVNSSWLGDKIRFHHDINIGVAVAVEDGLLVPVIRNADYKSLSQLNTEIKNLADKAKNKKLTPEEMQGNTFTISNLGMFGIDEFTAIINPPDACILAIGGIHTKPIVKNENIVIGNTMKVTLSCDHRVVDGATGAKFLQTLKSLLEEPVRILA
jgi:pyruvate dehydrogenase E2 component (dihydrolipoamide acetyltransferase)